MAKNLLLPDGPKIRFRRIELRLTYEAVHKRGGPSRNTMAKAEKGEPISSITAGRIARALDLPVQDFLMPTQSDVPIYWGYRPAAHRDIHSALLNCTSELLIVGTGLTTVEFVLKDPDVVASLTEVLHQPHPPSMTVVALRRANHLHRHGLGRAQLPSKVQHFRAVIRPWLRKRLGGIRIRTYKPNVIPRHFILKADDTIYFGSYLTHKIGAESYLIKLEKSNQDALYALLEEEVKHIVSESIPY